jgi:hypothetical protein
MPAYVTRDLGKLQAGIIVEVTPEQPGNILLLDPPNLALYRRGRQGRAVGAAAVPGIPVRLIVPQSGTWTVVVDRGGARGTIRAAVNTLDPTSIDADITEVVGQRLSGQALLNRTRRS